MRRILWACLIGVLFATAAPELLVSKDRKRLGSARRSKLRIGPQCQVIGLVAIVPRRSSFLRHQRGWTPLALTRINITGPAALTMLRTMPRRFTRTKRKITAESALC